MTHAESSPPPTPDAGRVRTLLERSGRDHDHECPRQILGIRMTLLASHLLGLDLPREDKRVLAISETDGCFLSGIEEAGGLHANRRTLRIVDCGRVAATFVDTKTEKAWRIAPHVDVRARAAAFAPGAKHRFGAMMDAYVTLPTEDLLVWEAVRLEPTAKTLVARPHVRVACAGCGEEVINQRERLRDGRPFCPVCVGEGYYERGVPED